MEKTEYELARQSQEDARLTAISPMDDDVILATAVRSNVDLENVEEFEELRFRLTGVDLSGYQLAGGRQELHGDTLIVRRVDWAALDPGYRLPYSFMDLREVLEPEPLIQSDDPRIVEHARRITARRSEWNGRATPAPERRRSRMRATRLPHDPAAPEADAEAHEADTPVPS